MRIRTGRCHKARPAKACSPVAPMSQYIYTMNGVSKTVPPKRQIIKDISLSFFPGAKIGLLGLNGAGKSTVLKIMAGVDTDFSGEARQQARSEEHTSELLSLMRISYAVFCLKKKNRYHPS